MISLLQHYLFRSAERDPAKTALVMGAERLTFGELEAGSNRLARLLIESGCRRGDRVCLLVPKSPAAILGMLGVLKADCAYVPVNVSSPAPYAARIIESAEPRLVLAGRDTSALVEALTAGGALGPDRPIGLVQEPTGQEGFQAAFTPSDFGSFSPEPLSYANGSDDLAHLLFTSGSTGVPKGVMIAHSNVIRFVEWGTSYFGISSQDRLSGHAPLHFDLSTFDLYGSLCAGAELHLVPPEANVVSRKLAELIRDAELTQWFSVPSVLSYMAKFDVVREDYLRSLERVIWCGEVLPTPTLMHWMKRLPDVQFTNLYGPTEATIASSYYTVPSCPADPTAPIPIGQPCAGEELTVLDSDMCPIPIGEIGELYIGGVGLSPGYWRDEAKTRSAFRPHPTSAEPGARLYRTGDLASIGEDGLVYFLGRVDSQVKSRGYRIELGEIEAALNALEQLKESAVVGVDTSGFEGTAICCAYAPMDGQEVRPPAVRKTLSQVLPAYMLPSRWLTFEELPKNVNGKIDRRRLRETFEEQASAAKPAMKRAVQ
jgi:amino acid adenylation domain-containing protein